MHTVAQFPKSAQLPTLRRKREGGSVLVGSSNITDSNGRPVLPGDRVQCDNDDGGTTVLLTTSRGGVVTIGGDSRNGTLFTECWQASQMVVTDMPPAEAPELVELYQQAGIATAVAAASSSQVMGTRSVHLTTPSGRYTEALDLLEILDKVEARMDRLLEALPNRDEMRLTRLADHPIIDDDASGELADLLRALRRDMVTAQLTMGGDRDAA